MTNQNVPDTNIQTLYPELYNQLKPYIDDAIQRFRNGEINQSTLESVVEDILMRSGFSQYMTTEESSDDDAVVPAQRMFNRNFGPWNPPRRRPFPPRPRPPFYPPPYYGWGPPITPRNLVRLLLLQQLFGV